MIAVWEINIHYVIKNNGIHIYLNKMMCVKIISGKLIYIMLLRIMVYIFILIK